MKHGRPDYNRIQDPASDFALLEAYRDAQRLLRDVVDAPLAPGALAFRNPLQRVVSALVHVLDPVVAAPPRNPIGIDEPVFLLRASDSIAPGTVREYARYFRQRSNVSNLWLQHELIVDVAKAMEDWQTRHNHKLPDVPAVRAPGGGS